VEVEPFALSASAGAKVGREPTTTAGTTDVASRWGEEEGTPPCTSAGH
jgi:hypothetical protein